MIKELFKTQKGVNSAEAQFKKMTETPINKLITSLSVPTVISMLITNIYNATDTYFVSKINIAASGATGVVFSLMAILQAFGFMFGHGSGSCISRHLGAQDIEKAKRYSSTGFFSFADRRDCDHGARIDISDPSYDASGQHSNHFALCQRLRDLHTAFRSGYDCELRCKQYFEI